jgi:hypothetical protein
MHFPNLNNTICKYLYHSIRHHIPEIIVTKLGNATLLNGSLERFSPLRYQPRNLFMDGACSTNGEKRNACRILVGKPDGKRPLGRPRRR